MKQCPKCPAPRLESDFYVNRRRSDGLTLYCKKHHKEITDKSREQRRQLSKTHNQTLKTREQVKDGSVDAGLLLLLLTTPRDTHRTQKEIAFVCGCHHQYISAIERQALRKLRNAFLSDSHIQEFVRGQIAA